MDEEDKFSPCQYHYPEVLETSDVETETSMVQGHAICLMLKLYRGILALVVHGPVLSSTALALS